MSAPNDGRRINLVTAITVTLSLAVFVSSASAGGGAVNHERVTLMLLLRDAPTLAGDVDGSGAKSAAVILFFRRDRMWDGGFASSHKVLFPELFRSALMPKTADHEVLHSEALMKKWADVFDSSTALADLVTALALEGNQKRALHNIATNFIQGCDVELRELLSEDGRNAQMENKSPDFWGGYWVGVSQGLWTGTAVDVDRILNEDQKKVFEVQIEKWRKENATLLKEQIQTH